MKNAPPAITTEPPEARAARLRRRAVAPAVVTAALALTAGLLGTATAGSSTVLRGTIYSEDSEPLPGVLLSLICGDPAVTRPVRLLSGADGGYVFVQSEAGRSCTLRAEIPGYATVEAGPVALRPGRETRLDLRLIPSASATEVIRVEAHGAMVETETTMTSTTLNVEFIESLPLVGRSFQDLLTLAPGVTDVDGDGNPNVHGARDTGLQYRLDGADITDPLTGKFGQFLNIDAVQEVELITSGAPAEYSRADGGFANIITRSGGNKVEGAARVFFRDRWFDGEGADNEDFFVRSLDAPVEYQDLKIALTLGGPIARDHVWYFASVQSLAIETPVSFGRSGRWTVTERGWQGFAKLTWQASGDHRLSVQATFDPRRLGGLGLGLGVLPESDFLVRTGGLTTTLRWSAILSPVLLLETTISHFDSGEGYEPVAPNFEPVPVRTRLEGVGSGLVPYAFYPCNLRNCDRSSGRTNLYQVDLENNQTSGPFYYEGSDQRRRVSLREDLVLSLADRLGEHTVKFGFEYADESYGDLATENPILFSSLRPAIGDRTGTGGPGAVTGNQLLQVASPRRASTHATGGGLGVWLQDTWRPVPNLTLSLGLRLDLEAVDAAGQAPFTPRREARRALHVFDLACSLAGSLCEMSRLPGRPSGNLPLALPIPMGHPLEAYDLDEDGFFEGGIDQDGKAIWGSFTTPDGRESEWISLRNRNLAPRLAIAWDPLKDGRTRVAATWGRYYDRLFLGTLTAEQFSDSTTYAFFPRSSDEAFIDPGDRSSITSARTTYQVSRDLTTPYVNEWTVSVEREVAPEWSVRLTAVGKRWWDLLQDVDVNHIVCADFRRAYGIDPQAVCGVAGRLDPDRFGGVDRPAKSLPPASDPGARSFTSQPNGIPDLYVVNPHFNSIFRIGNENGSRYRSLELVVTRRLHRNWQLQGSWTRSAAEGDAEDFFSLLGDDPTTAEDEEGFLSYDQRHVVKVLASAHLRHRVILGGTVQWASGTPYSVVAREADLDDRWNAQSRRIYVSGRRNDQRNGGSWTASARIEKGFDVARASAEAFFAVENLLGNDDLLLSQYNTSSRSGIFGSNRRRFGRRWETGLSFHF